MNFNSKNLIIIMEQSVLSEEEILKDTQLSVCNRSFEHVKIILKEYKKRPLYYRLLDLTFIQKDFRNVYAFFVSWKQTYTKDLF